MEIKEAIEVLKKHKSTTDKFNHTVGNVKVSEAIDTVVSHYENLRHMYLPKTVRKILFKKYL